ncbi:hypothetical protein ACEPAI_8587 [Sanghuangporus weigelae]
MWAIIPSQSQGKFTDTIRVGIQGRLEFAIVPDIIAADAFDEAVKGVDAIINAASPTHLEAVDPDGQVISAGGGTFSILNSHLDKPCNIHIVRKGREAGQYDKYHASKDIAAKVESTILLLFLRKHTYSHAINAASWSFVFDHKSDITWDLSVVCPIYVFGPVLREVNSPADLNSSSAMFYDALVAKDNKATLEDLAPINIDCDWVDVHDVALCYVRALEVPEAGGERFILTSRYSSGRIGLMNELKNQIPGFNGPARRMFNIEFQDMLTTTKDTLEDYKARGRM